MSVEGRRNTVDEIIIKYKRTKDKSIYVEGSSDKAIIKWFLRKAALTNISVLEIQMINIDVKKIVELGLDNNNRDRIITLCHLVNNGIIGIIDSDFDFIDTTACYQFPYLFTTDYSSMEMYCFNEESLEKIFLGHSPKEPTNYQNFMDMLSDILVDLFLIRFAKEKLKKELTYKELKYLAFNEKKYLSSKDNVLQFERDKYLKNYLSNKDDVIEKFNTLIESKKESLPTDVKKVIHGHDFEDLLLFYLDITQKDAKATFKKLLYSVLEFDILKETKLFKNILTNLP